MQILEDRSVPGCVYYGITPLFDTATSDNKWQIMRTTYDGSDLVTLFANDGKYNAIWDDRASLFPACPPNPVPVPGTIDTNTVTKPTIAIVSMPLANNEYSYSLPAGTKRFILKNKAAATIQVGITPGETTNVWPLEPATTYSEAELGADQTFYFRSGQPSQELVVFSWS